MFVLFLIATGLLAAGSLANAQQRGAQQTGNVQSPPNANQQSELPTLQAVQARESLALLAAPKKETSEERNERFARYMTGVKLVGRFTLVGVEDNKPKEESYTITKCEKLPFGNLFRFTTRIKYGKTDLTVPVQVPVKWAGNTPVISLDDFTIPGMGTFSARVTIHHDRYAGTWDHGPKGGHLFGVIQRMTNAQIDESPAEDVATPKPASKP
ncbi:MAG: hypothetical protein AAFP69_00450 [Planctomycetota bacterium]